MNRRELLKSVAPLAAMVAAPVLVKGQEVGKAFKLEPDAKYLVFVNGRYVDVQQFANESSVLPPGTQVHEVILRAGTTFDDVIRIFKV